MKNFNAYYSYKNYEKTLNDSNKEKEESGRVEETTKFSPSIGYSEYSENSSKYY